VNQRTVPLIRKTGNLCATNVSLRGGSVFEYRSHILYRKYTTSRRSRLSRCLSPCLFLFAQFIVPYHMIWKRSCCSFFASATAPELLYCLGRYESENYYLINPMINPIMICYLPRLIIQGKHIFSVLSPISETNEDYCWNPEPSNWEIRN